MRGQAAVRDEMRRRVGALGGEVADWRARAAGNVDQFGIHASQLFALAEMMQVLGERQEGALGKLDPGLAAVDFSRAYVDLLREVVGAQDVWRAFRTIIGQHFDPWLGKAADAADLVAASCYRTVIERARALGAIDEARLREPPLVCLEPAVSAATASRGERVEALRLSFDVHRAQRLPIPVVFLPVDQLGCVWLWCTIHHEVGHNLDQDLALGTELAMLAAARLERDGVPSERARFWGLWGEEVLADAIGVLLGGAGFGHCLASLLAALGGEQKALDAGDVHPPHVLRAWLAAALLDATGVPRLKNAAVEIRADAPPVPDWSEDLAKDLKAIAQVYLDAPLAALLGNPLRALVPGIANDADRVLPLVTHLATGFMAPPKGTAADPFPWRLVPVAAELALVGAEPEGDPPSLATAMQGIHERALAFIESIPRPNQLAGAAGRKAAIREQTRAIRFGGSAGAKGGRG